MFNVTTEADLKTVFFDDNPMPSSVMKTSGYGNLSFECGCGSTHGVNDYSIEQVASFRPVKILFKCSTHYTKVKIKGIFTQKCISEATFTVALMDRIIKEKGLN